MPNLAEYEALCKRLDDAKQERVRHVHEQRIPRLMDVSFKAQTVVDHPGWQLYLDKIESRVREIQATRDATAQRMVTGSEMGHDLELLKINLNAMDAEIAGLKYAASLVPEAIHAGLISLGVTGQAAAGSIAG